MSAAPTVAAQPARPLVAVLPLAANDTGVPYNVLPTRSELDIMTDKLRTGLEAGNLTLVAQPRVASAVSAAGFDQTVPARSCTVVTCAQAIGRAVHADVVVVGAVTRAMAVVWSTDFSIVDVKTGTISGAMNVGYKGDVHSMERGERYAGGCIARVIKHEKACKPDRGW